MPAMKNSAPHTIRISMVWPKSGSITSSDTSVSSSTSAIEVAGISGRRVDSANSHAASTTKAGLADSEAWMLTPIRVIQRREPLTSGPISSVATISAIETANTISAVRRICRGDRNDTPISTMKDGSRNSTWRLKKWKGSSPIRVATGGLAASDRMMPRQHQRDDRRRAAGGRPSTTIRSRGCVVHGRAWAFPRPEGLPIGRP